MKVKAKQSTEERWATELVRERMKESQAIVHLGFDVEKVEKGRAIFQLDVRSRHEAAYGVNVHPTEKRSRRGGPFFSWMYVHTISSFMASCTGGFWRRWRTLRRRSQRTPQCR